MKISRIVLLGFVLLCLILSLNTVSPVFAQDTSYEEIHSYNVNIDVRPDGKLSVEERILYDFGSAQRHGIFRHIPYRYSLKTAEGTKQYDMDISVTSVTDGSGSEYQYSLTDQNQQQNIKIGDPNATLTGEHLYILKYEVSGGMRYFETHDELYWNAIGTEWDVGMQEAVVKVTHPYSATAPSEEYRYRCLGGYLGQNDYERCQVGQQEVSQDGKQASVTFSVYGLLPNQGITVVAGMPQGSVVKLYPREFIDFADTLGGQLIILAVILAGIFWYAVYPVWIALKWLMYGRDPYVGPAPTALYDVPLTKNGRELSPAEAGTLIDENVQKRDVLAMVVDLARRGYLNIIEQEEDDYYIEKVEREDDGDLAGFEKYFLADVFSESTSIRLKDADLISVVQEIEKMLYESMVRENFFLSNPKKSRSFYGHLLIFALPTLNIPLVLSCIFFGLHMPRKTLLGSRQSKRAEGLRSFLKSQERQINFTEADPQVMFEKLLPYAVAFGVEKQWMKKFASIQLDQPTWYVSHSSIGTFSTNDMLSGMQSSFKSFNAAATPVSSSSGFSSGGGGGFSGGGGGGGGGGSW